MRFDRLLDRRGGRRRRGGHWDGLGSHGRFLGGRLCALLAEVRAYLFGNVIVEGARMRPLVGDAQLGKIVQYRFAFDFQFPRQIVDTNLTHVPSFSPWYSSHGRTRPATMTLEAPRVYFTLFLLLLRTPPAQSRPGPRMEPPR